jgi:hypothetical protein
MIEHDHAMARREVIARPNPQPAILRLPGD